MQDPGMRDKVYIADKLPQYMIKSNAVIERYFQEQLKRLQTGHIDYYLMHMLTDVEAWNNLKKRGILEWIDEKKKSGAIGNIGFSFHGNTEMFLKILNDYDWDMCQVQYNYMNENSPGWQGGAYGSSETRHSCRHHGATSRREARQPVARKGKETHS